MNADLVKRARDFSKTLNFYISDCENGIGRVPRGKLVEIQNEFRELAQALESPVAQPVPVGDETIDQYADRLEREAFGRTVLDPPATPQPASAGPVVALEAQPEPLRCGRCVVLSPEERADRIANGLHVEWAEGVGYHYFPSYDPQQQAPDAVDKLREGDIAGCTALDAVTNTLSSSPPPVGVSEAVLDVVTQAADLQCELSSHYVLRAAAQKLLVSLLHSQPPAPKEPASGVTEASE